MAIPNDPNEGPGQVSHLGVQLTRRKIGSFGI